MKIAVITTLNSNLIKAKLIPLARVNKVEEIYFISDSAGPAIPKVKYFVPSRFLYFISLHKSLAKFFLLLQVSLRFKPDIIMAYNILPHGYSAFLVGKLLRKKVYLHLIGGYSDVITEAGTSDNSLVRKLPSIAMLLTMLNKYVVKKSDLIFVPGNNTYNLINKLGIPEEKIIQLHSTIDTVTFSPGNNLKIFDIIIVSALVVRKRIDLFLKVISIVKKSIPDIKAAILGTGSLKDELIELCRKNNLVDNVCFLGFHKNIETFYNQSKIFVLTSNFEGLSCSALEAMSSGLPVVVPNVGDMKQVAIDEVTGFLIDDINNPSAYAEKIIKLLQDDNLREIYSNNAARLIKEFHSIESAQDKWENILTKLV